jgi:hypothetical protein
MSTFKITKKNALSDNRTNIYDLHEKKLEHFRIEKQNLNNYITQKELLTSELGSSPEIKKEKLLNEINDLTLKINDITNETEQTKYLLDFLCIINKNKFSEYLEYSENNQIISTNKTNLKDLLKRSNTEIKMDSFVNTEINTSRSELYNDYIRTFYPSLTQISIPKKDVTCKLCKSSSFIYDSKNGNEVCSKCGLSNFLLVSEDSPHVFNENVEQINVFNYKRHNHFQECLNQLQAKENTTIPEKIIRDLRDEFKKYNITDKNIITPSLVKSYLKKLKYNKYYEHIPTIINELCGIDAPKMTRELEEQLKIMFDEIQIPFEKYSKLISPERKNFLNYNYIFYKMCQLLNKDEFLNCFPLLKSREKLYEHDLIWKGICKDLRWEFIPSI